MWLSIILFLLSLSSFMWLSVPSLNALKSLNMFIIVFWNSVSWISSNLISLGNITKKLVIWKTTEYWISLPSFCTSRFTMLFVFWHGFLTHQVRNPKCDCGLGSLGDPWDRMIRGLGFQWGQGLVHSLSGVAMEHWTARRVGMGVTYWGPGHGDCMGWLWCTGPDVECARSQGR